MLEKHRSMISPIGLSVFLISLRSFLFPQHYGADGMKTEQEIGARYNEIFAEIQAKYSAILLPRMSAERVGQGKHLELENGSTVMVKALSKKPPIFEVKKFLTPAECDLLVQLAQERGLQESRTLDDNEDADVQRLLEINKFTSWDEDRTGFIEIKEIRRVFEQLFDFDYEDENVLQMIKELKIDRNEDGLISEMEFIEFDLNNTAASFIKHINKIKAEQPVTKGRFSEQTFLSDGKHPLLLQLRQRLSLLTGLPTDLIEGSEDLQVVKYTPGGHYNCHLDSEEIPRFMDKCCHLPGAGDATNGHCQLCRYMTVLYFLNDVEEGGETAFPLADNKTLNPKVWSEDEDGLCNLARNCMKSRVVVKPEKGKAIFWYNHLLRRDSGWLGQVDYRSVHGGCNVLKGEKWIANNWINVSPIRMEDLKFWASMRLKNESGLLDSHDPVSGDDAASEEDNNDRAKKGTFDRDEKGGQRALDNQIDLENLEAANLAGEGLDESLHHEISTNRNEL